MTLPVNIDGTWVNQSTYLDAGEARRADAASFAGAGAALGVAGGVARHGDTSLAVTVDGSDIVTIQAGAVLIPGNAVAGTGCYRFGLGTATTGTLAARNATNPRITLVVARYLDTDVVGAHGAYTGRIELIDGTPAGSPAVPSLPTMAVELARITVPATGGGLASVDSTHRTYATAIGGELVVPTASMLPTSAATYQMARALDTGFRHRFNGTTWDALETAWTTVSSLVTSGGIRYKRLGDEVYVQIDGSCSVTSATDVTLSTGTIPVGLRPNPPVGTAYRSGGYFNGQSGTIWVLSSGEVHGRQNSGGTTTTVAGLIKYPLG